MLFAHALLGGLDAARPQFVERLDWDSRFDWTWEWNGEKERHLSSPIPIVRHHTHTRLLFDPRQTTVVLNIRDGSNIVVDDKELSPATCPFPLPKGNIREYCRAGRISHGPTPWTACQPAEETCLRLPSIRRMLVGLLYNKYIGTELCTAGHHAVIFDSNTTYRFYGHFHPTLHIPEPPGPAAISEVTRVYEYNEIANLVYSYYGHPGHFPHQALPKILRALAVIPPTTKLLVNTAGVAGMFIDALIQRGILSRERIVSYDPIDRRKVIFGRTVYAVAGEPHHGWWGLHGRDELELVRDVFAPRSQWLPVAHRRLVVLIKRPEGRQRFLVNHVELLFMLRSHPSVVKEDLRVIEFHGTEGLNRSIEIFQNARIVIGPHGAAFFNLMFGPSNLSVIEMGNSRWFPDMYYHMAVHLGQNYWVSGAQRTKERNLVANISEIRDYVKESLSMRLTEEPA